MMFLPFLSIYRFFEVEMEHKLFRRSSLPVAYDNEAKLGIMPCR
jgi:hypothetical protein